MNPFHGTIVAGEHVPGTTGTKFTVHTQDSSAEVILNKKVMVCDLTQAELSTLRDLRYCLMSMRNLDPELAHGLQTLTRLLNDPYNKRPTKD